jgi:hypothetical protein
MRHNWLAATHSYLEDERPTVAGGTMQGVSVVYKNNNVEVG